MDPVVGPCERLGTIHARAEPRQEPVDPIVQRRRVVEHSGECPGPVGGKSAEELHDPPERRHEQEAEHDMEKELTICPRAVSTGPLPILRRKGRQHFVEPAARILKLARDGGTRRLE